MTTRRHAALLLKNSKREYRNSKQIQMTKNPKFQNFEHSEFEIVSDFDLWCVKSGLHSSPGSTVLVESGSAANTLRNGAVRIPGLIRSSNSAQMRELLPLT